MGSLFDHDRCCDDNQVSGTTKCKGCICRLLDRLANGDLCKTGTLHRVMIKNKGTSEFVSADGIDPTIFTLLSFDPKTCCAIFSFEAMTNTSPVRTVTRRFVEDCHQIAGLAFVEDDNLSSVI